MWFAMCEIIESMLFLRGKVGGGATYPAARISGECSWTAKPSSTKMPIVDSA